LLPREKNCLIVKDMEKEKNKVVIKKINNLEELIEVLQDIENYVSLSVDNTNFSYYVIPSKKKGYYIKVVFNG
jgi:hypothetical protein